MRPDIELLPPSVRARMREGSYTTTQNSKPVTVSVTDGDTLKDAADLWAVIKGEYQGTKSAASESIKEIVGTLQSGAPLSDAQWATFHRLKDKYAQQLAGFRAGPDNDVEGFVPLPPTGAGRIQEAAFALDGQLRRLMEQYATPSTTAKDKGGTAAHLADSVLHDLAHTRQHIARILEPDVKANPQSVAFNAEHALNHAESAQDHIHKLDKHLGKEPSDPTLWAAERKALNKMRESLGAARIQDTITLAQLREGRPTPPPNLRVAAPHDEATENQQATPVHECGTCKMFNYGTCWGYGNMPVDDDWVCDSWQADPSWKTQNAMIDGPDLVGMALAQQAREDSGKYMGGSRVYDPLLLRADAAHAAEAAEHLLSAGRVRVQGQGEAAQGAAADLTRRVGDRAGVRTLAVRGNPYTQLTAVREATTWPERVRVLHEAAVKTETETVAADPARPDTHKPTIAVDFDGVIHMGGHGMPGEVEGQPVDGAKDGLKALADRYRVVILTARQDFAAVRRWLGANGMEQYVDRVTNVKPQALAYIDDRAIHFAGDWPAAVAAANPAKATAQPIQVKKTYEAVGLLSPSMRRQLEAA